MEGFFSFSAPPVAKEAYTAGFPFFGGADAIDLKDIAVLNFVGEDWQDIPNSTGSS